MGNSRKSVVLSLCVGVCLAVAAQGTARAGTVKVFILAGQSNMQGHATVECLEYQATKGKNKDVFAFCRQSNAWVERGDVWINYLNRRGKLTVGYGAPGRQPAIGPELGFGFTVGDQYEEPVLLIKTAWGGKSLARDFLPPSVGLPSEAALQAELEKAHKKKPNLTMEELKAGYGAYYRLMLSEVKTTLAELDQRFPALAGKQPELCGLVWFQGWNDMINPAYTAAYAHNMAAFIRDVRKDLNVPHLPVVIGQMGVGGMEGVPAKNQALRDAQAAVLKIDEFRGNVALVPTGLYWDKDAAALDKEWHPPGKNAPREESRKYMTEWQAKCLAAGRSNAAYHYLGSPKTLCQIGKAFGEAMIALPSAATK